MPYGDDNNDIYSNDDYEDDSQSSSASSGYNAETVIHTIPKFVSEPRRDLVNEGGTIRLPCVVDRLGKNKFSHAKTYGDENDASSSIESLIARNYAHENQFSKSFDMTFQNISSGREMQKKFILTFEGRSADAFDVFPL